MSKYSWNEVLENREKWLAFLEKKGRKKAAGHLDIGGGQRCCLGHACYILGISRKWEGHDYDYDGSVGYAPESLVEKIGLTDRYGSIKDSYDDPKRALADMNDQTDMSPQDIAAFIRANYERVFLTREEYETRHA